MSASHLAPRRRQRERQSASIPAGPPQAPRLRVTQDGPRAPSLSPGRPWPAARRSPRGARHRPAQGTAPPGRRWSQGPAYSPQAPPRRASPGEKGGDKKRPQGPPRQPKGAPARGLRPRPTPTVVSAWPRRRSGSSLSAPCGSTAGQTEPSWRMEKVAGGESGKTACPLNDLKALSQYCARGWALPKSPSMLAKLWKKSQT